MRRPALGASAIVLTVCSLLSIQNGLLNFALPALLNGRPERLRIDYTAAYMIVPGRVTVYGLQIRSQGIGDQWVISAERATGVVALDALFERRFQASGIQARGTSLRFRRRAAAPNPEAALTEPPIPGLVNPPDPDPDLLYPRDVNPWHVALHDIRADVREIWVGDYRLIGSASVGGDVSFAGPIFDLEGDVAILQMRGDIGSVPVVNVMHGEVSLLVDAMDRSHPGSDLLSAISGHARLDTEVEDLRFLDFYLAAVPWLSLAGSGQLDLDVGLEQGLFQTGSVVGASFPEIVVRVLGNEISGTGEVHADVGPGDDGALRTLINVDFTDFAITREGAAGVFVEGVGFHIDAESPDHRLDRPLTTVRVRIDLPESSIPGVAPYNAYLPQGLGLSLDEGTGSIRGHLIASTEHEVASGDLYMHGHDIVARLDAIAVTGDVEVHAQLAEARLDEGIYDLSGSTVDLRRVGLIDREQAHKSDGERLWSALVTVPSGVVRIGAPVYLDANLALTCSDSVPFITLFAEKKALPGWVQGLLSVREVSGEARLRLGEQTLELQPCQIRGGSYSVDLRYRRAGTRRDGDLLVRAGPLSVGVALRPTGPDLQLFGARRWFESRAP